MSREISTSYGTQPEDLPHAEILSATRQAYGQGFFEVWNEYAQLSPLEST
jgi:hypothetical protein